MTSLLLHLAERWETGWQFGCLSGSYSGLLMGLTFWIEVSQQNIWSKKKWTILLGTLITSHFSSKTNYFGKTSTNAFTLAARFSRAFFARYALLIL